MVLALNRVPSAAALQLKPLLGCIYNRDHLELHLDSDETVSAEDTAAPAKADKRVGSMRIAVRDADPEDVRRANRAAAHTSEPLPEVRRLSTAVPTLAAAGYRATCGMHGGVVGGLPKVAELLAHTSFATIQAVVEAKLAYNNRGRGRTSETESPNFLDSKRHAFTNAVVGCYGGWSEKVADVIRAGDLYLLENVSFDLGNGSSSMTIDAHGGRCECENAKTGGRRGRHAEALPRDRAGPRIPGHGPLREREHGRGVGAAAACSGECSGCSTAVPLRRARGTSSA